MTTTTASTSITTPENGHLLRTVLRENAAFSLLSGVVLAAGSAALDEWLGVEWWILLGVGLGLIGFAASVWIGAAKPALLRTTGQTTIVGDLGWILGAVVIVAATDWMTDNGEIALLAVTAVVACFAVGQTIGLRRLNR